MGLNNLRLFKNVKITPDYSVVHDMTPETWRQYLNGELWETNPDWNNDSPEIVFSQDVNYYRLPDTIRIEGNYDELRQVTYGYLQDTKGIRTPSFGTIFFFVEDVRLLKQGSRFDSHQEGTEEEPVVYVDAVDVCELDIKIDVWSSYGGAFQLYDSYVERRHMDRWKNTGTEEEPVWEPIYYPNAAQGIEGAYKVENIEKIVKGKEFPGTDLSPFIYRSVNVQPDKNYDVGLEIGIMTYLSREGELKILAFANCLISETTWDKDYSASGSVFYNDNGIKLVLDPLSATTETFLTAVGLSAEFIQSFNVIKAPQNIQDALTSSSDGEVVCPLLGYKESVTIDDTEFIYFNLIGGSEPVRDLMLPSPCSINPVTPDRSHVDEGDVDSSQYYDEHEPMMYYNPARSRKVIASLGGELFEVPDIVAFENQMYMSNMIDIASLNQSIGVKENASESNALGAYGLVTPPSLPIFNSAWRSYDAISKVSDTIMYNAKQMQTIGGGLTGTALGTVGGATQGGPVGAIAGLISGIVGTGLSYYGNDEELRAKRAQIKNSPCVVKSTGTGFTNAYLGLIDCYYATLKMDDQSMEKLRFMYYWYGYHVNRVFKGDIDLHTRTRFDFIKTSGARVKGDLTAGAAKEIGSIFDRGVTIYHGPEGYALIGSGDMVSNDEV